ncbi:MAG TPA: Hpt domain-containing protein [Caulobacterales bacterium]|nr:Hpt domain-containing protein [Caulobacterales bacterium]
MSAPVQPVLFDRAHFAVMTGEDRALQLEVVGLFRQQAEAMAGLLAADAPAAVWRPAAHKLKGSARAIGLWRLAQACLDAEEAGAEAGETLAAVRAALAEALEALSAHGFPAKAA